MKYLVDTANLEKIEYVCKYYPIAGVTTNPSICSKEGGDFRALIASIRRIIGQERQLHVQTTAKKYEDIIEEAKIIASFGGENTFTKIPVSPDGLRATAELHKLGYGVTETAIFTPEQAMLAAEAGADYVAPYVNRLDNILADGVGVVSEIVELFNIYGYDTEVLAASFKTAEQIHKVALAGAHTVTIGPELFDIIVSHPMTDDAVRKFDGDWAKAFGDATVAKLLK